MSAFADRLEREVCATPEEFCRGLRAAFPGQVSGGPKEFEVAARGAAVAIAIAPAPPRAIASLVLPRLSVSIRFTAGDAAQQRALIETLDRATQRGGG